MDNETARSLASPGLSTEVAAGKTESPEEVKSNGSSSPPSSAHRDREQSILSFPDNDPEDPYNWPSSKKAFVVAVGVIAVLNSTVCSSVPSGDVIKLSAHYGVSSVEQQVLPISMYLVGYIFGPLFFGPLSEGYGRRIVMLGTFAGFTIFTLATTLAPNWVAFNVFRVFTGVFAGSPISVTGGMYADLYGDPVTRGRAMTFFMTATIWGPIGGPISSGYLQKYGWMWPFWFALIFSGVSWITVIFLPETYGPVILKRRAKKMRRENPGMNVYGAIELETKSLKDIVWVILARPIRMFCTEAIVLFSCIYTAMIYAVFYMFLQVYPFIFPKIYGFSPGETGLAFLPIGIGAIVACSIYLWWDRYLEKAKKRQAPWSAKEEYRRLPLACIGGPFFSISMFWLGWSARTSVHWIVPLLAGIPYGVGYLLLFMSLLNYITDAYEIFAASGLAAAACSRSFLGAVLPFAGEPMFTKLGIAWACTLLGFVSLAMCAIPFVFIWFGDRIRANSKFCQELENEKRRLAEEKAMRNSKYREESAISNGNDAAEKV